MEAKFIVFIVAVVIFILLIIGRSKYPRRKALPVVDMSPEPKEELPERVNDKLVWVRTTAKEKLEAAVTKYSGLYSDVGFNPIISQKAAADQNQFKAVEDPQAYLVYH